jgi:hypothetical protein
VSAVARVLVAPTGDDSPDVPARATAFGANVHLCREAAPRSTEGFAVLTAARTRRVLGSADDGAVE